MRSTGKYISFFLAPVLAIGCAGEPKLQERTKILMGTVVTVKAYVGRGQDAHPRIDAALAEISRIDSICGYMESSDVSRINGSSGRPVEVSREVAAIVEKSLRYSRLSRGALDITVGAVSRLWNGFDSKDMLIPPRASIDSALSLVDYRNVTVLDSSVMLGAEGSSIDLGALAKGYAVDRAVTVLESLGVKAALVDAGGDIGTLGARPDGASWRIGLKHPRMPDSMLTVFELEDRAIATSGDYERYFVKDDVRYHHILNPRTGFPARGCCSVTVVSEEALDADAIATAVYVLGPEEGMELVESLLEVEALIVVCDGMNGEKVFRSSGLAGYMRR